VTRFEILPTCANRRGHHTAPTKRGPYKKREAALSKRIDKSWVVFISIENSDHDRCVDLFSRPDGSYGFEEFRRDVEDRGEWTPVSYYSGSSYPSGESVLEAAKESVIWLEDAIKHSPSAQRLLPKNSN
jgi:hypothetical protein